MSEDNKIDISTEICGIKFPSCIMNASGVRCTTLEELIAIKNSEAGAIVTKSITKEPRIGNLEPRYHDFGFGSLQSMGLPNPGKEKAKEILYELKYKGNCINYSKPLIVSLAGGHFMDYVLMLEDLKDLDINMFEINVSCPNTGKDPIAYDLFQLENIVSTVMSCTNYLRSKGFKAKIGLKLPPYYKLNDFEKVSDIIKKYKIDFITTSNSIANALIIDPITETTVIKPNKGLGGLGGKAIKPIALANVKIFYNLLGNEMPIIGVGGISNEEDIFEHILCGASAVQVGTYFQRYGTYVFEWLENDLKRFMAMKGYKSINDFRGKLKNC